MAVRTGITLLLQTPERASSSLTPPRSSALALQNIASFDVGWSRTYAVRVEQPGHERQALRRPAV